MKNGNVFDFHIHIYKHVFFCVRHQIGVVCTLVIIIYLLLLSLKKKRKKRKNRKPSRTYINMLYNDLSVL